MTEYTAFRIDTQTLEKLRIIADLKQRSMAGQVRYFVDRELKDLREGGDLADLTEDQLKLVEA